MSAIQIENHFSFPSPERSAQPAKASRAVWTGRILSGLGVAFLAMDVSMKLFETRPALEATAQLGYPASTVFGLGVLELVLLVAYLVPRSSRASLILWTGYFGGAIASHVRVGNPLFSHVLFPIYIALFLWVGLLLRDQRLRAALRSFL